MNYFFKAIRFTALLIFLIFIVAGTSAAQFRLTDWKTHTSFFETRETSVDSQGRIWVATSGGVYNYDRDSGKITPFRNTEGLLDMDVSTIKCDRDRKIIFIGCYDGTFEILSEDYSWRHELAIKNHNFADAGINDFLIVGDDLFIAGNFGIAVYDLNEFVFRETITKIADFRQNVPVYKLILFNDQMWAATQEGVASIDLDSPNFSPDYWKGYGVSEGLPDKPVLGMTSLETIYVINDSELYKLEENEFTLVQSGNYSDLESTGGDIYLVDNLNIEVVGKYIIPMEHPGQLSSISFGPSENGNMIIVGYRYDAFAIYEDSTYTLITPNSPIANQFEGISVDADGNLWACPDGKTNKAFGFMMLSGDKWTNFTAKSNPELKYIKTYYKAGAFPDGKIVLSSWGGGMLFAEKKDTGYTFLQFDETNSSMNSGYPVCGDFVEDSYGNLWTCQYLPNTAGPLIIKVSPDFNFSSYDNEFNISQRNFLSAAIDQNNTIWLGSRDGAGIYYFNEMGTPYDATDDIYGRITTSDLAIGSNSPTALAYDRNDNLWIGSEKGVTQIIGASYKIIGSTLYAFELNDVKNESVNDIMIDALNYKWIATDNGIWIFDQAGEFVENINTKNSPLVSDEVLSLAADNKTGIIYIGTKQGLSQVQSLSVEPVQTYNIKCYPQPFKLSKHKELIIDGLAPNSEIRIVTIDGQFVRKIKAFGRTAVWDGIDDKGRKVHSGVYLILADSEVTGGSVVGKIAVMK